MKKWLARRFEVLSLWCVKIADWLDPLVQEDAE
jgi:hypothetical protein